MLTAGQLNEYLSELGLALSSVAVDAILEKASEADTCMTENGYSDSIKLMASLQLAGLLSISMGARRVSSQSAASGASRSYENMSITELHRSLVANLRIFDTSGCTTALIPNEPSNKASLMVVKGRV